jgi:energy-coupling factor transport system ATP-binding protein
VIKIQRLHYTYPQAERPALQDVSLSIAEGEFVLLAGPSGAGKSTLLRCLNGLVPYFSGGAIRGRIEVAGQNALEVGPQGLSGSVGFVFQDPEAQTVLDEVESEVAFGLENAAIPAGEMRARVHDALKVLGLQGLRHRSPWTLSGGERQKLAIASVLASRPKILALDEPTSQLDPAAARDLLETVARLNVELGLTVVLVEQRLERVVRYAERMVYLEAGRVTLDGPIREVLAEVETGQQPPLSRLAERLAWQVMPLSVDEGRQMAGGDISYRKNGANQTTEREGQTSGRPEPILQACQVYYGYNGHEVLRGVDLTIRPGESVALLGPNGTGKSTLLKCLVGLLRPQGGEVLLAGRPTAGKSVAEICRQVAYLPQTPDDLLFADSVGEELQITLANHGQASADQPVKDLLSELGLADLHGEYPRDLSVGQRQRVALGAVAVVRPKVLMLDEPTRGLDYATKDGLMALWRRWLNDGMALLLVTHDVEMATRIAQRVVVLEEGRITADGPVEEVLSRLEAFEPQMARLFPGRRWLTVAEVMAAVD